MTNPPDQSWDPEVYHENARFVSDLGGEGNVSAIVAAVDEELASRGLERECPWYFPSVEEYRAVLESAEFDVERIELIPLCFHARLRRK